MLPTIPVSVSLLAVSLAVLLATPATAETLKCRTAGHVRSLERVPEGGSGGPPGAGHGAGRHVLLRHGEGRPLGGHSEALQEAAPITGQRNGD